jgi:chitin synthase
MYRLRTADRGSPLIISDAVINDYSVCDVDTLHKKNLLSLGEDRYLTTLMTKHFPNMSNKFLPSAQCKTAAPESWSVLLSQRRRWINSTIHNLVELMRLKGMCGFCLCSMRFVVFIDLFGTIILPATCVYLGYLVYLIASHTGQFPMISIIMLAAVYGLQALIFILKRQWQHIGWMIIYILAFPIYSFILPIYSFWNQDNFSWGNTRIVIGEKGDKKVVAIDGEAFDPCSIPLQYWDDYALLKNLPGRRGGGGNMGGGAMYDLPMVDNPFDKEGSIHSGVQGSFHHPPSVRMSAMNMPPSPGYNAAFARNSTAFLNDPNAGMMRPQSMASLGGMAAMGGHLPYQDHPMAAGSMSNVGNMGNISPGSGGLGGMNRSSVALSNFNGGLRPLSVVDFQRSPTAGPDDFAIVDTIRRILANIDLDRVTKKQMRILVEQRLQTTLSPERRAFVDAQIDVELQNMTV